MKKDDPREKPSRKDQRFEDFLILRGQAVAAAKSLQSCLILCDPIDGSPPGSSVHGIFQARVPKWVAIAFSRGIRARHNLRSRALCCC